MSLHIVQFGTPRKAGEGLRIGTARRPPCGVPKAGFASRDFYDVWLPMLSPSAELFARALRVDDEKAWKGFERRFRAGMNGADASRMPDPIAALSKTTILAILCHCHDQARCHRSVLRELPAARGVRME